jgi:hypothetical protein
MRANNSQDPSKRHRYPNSSWQYFFFSKIQKQRIWDLWKWESKRRLDKSDHVKSCLLPMKAAGYSDLTAKLGSEKTIYGLQAMTYLCRVDLSAPKHLSWLHTNLNFHSSRRGVQLIRPFRSSQYCTIFKLDVFADTCWFFDPIVSHTWLWPENNFFCFLSKNLF